MAKRIRFIVTELGEEVDPFVIHLFAAMCERERATISARTRDALAAAKARGVQLGGPKLDEAREKAMAAVQAIADRNAAKVLPIIQAIQKSGATRAIPRLCLGLCARNLGEERSFRLPVSAGRFWCLVFDGADASQC
jgi:DNA invertase Pin-like site-specific DNA recombinase